VQQNGRGKNRRFTDS